MKENIKVLVIEDNRLAVERLVGVLREIYFVEIIGVFYSGVTALDHLRTQHVDLIITDIEMPELDGLSMIRTLGKKFQFIIVSGYRDHAVDGFDLDVIDYVLKPVSKERILKALFKYVDKQQREDLRGEVKALMGAQEIKPLEEQKASRFLMNVNNRIISVPYEDILYCKSDGDYLTVVTLAKGHTIKMTISSCEEKLKKHGFLRIHKSYLFNTAFYAGSKRYELQLNNGETIPIGRLYWKNLQDILKGMVN